MEGVTFEMEELKTFSCLWFGWYFVNNFVVKALIL